MERVIVKHAEQWGIGKKSYIWNAGVRGSVAGARIRGKVQGVKACNPSQGVKACNARRKASEACPPSAMPSASSACNIGMRTSHRIAESVRRASLQRWRWCSYGFFRYWSCEYSDTTLWMNHAVESLSSWSEPGVCWSWGPSLGPEPGARAWGPSLGPGAQVWGAYPRAPGTSTWGTRLRKNYGRILRKNSRTFTYNSRLFTYNSRTIWIFKFRAKLCKIMPE